MERSEDILETLGNNGNLLLKDIKDVRKRIEESEKELMDLAEIYYNAFKPDGYKSSTSYVDADTIKGSKKEFHLEDLAEEMMRIKNLIEVDKIILNSLERKIEVDIRLSELSNIKDKVFFLRKVMKLTQEATAEILGITDRHVRRIEKCPN